MRRLAMAALAFSGAVFCSHFMLPEGWNLYVMGAFLIAGLLSLLLKGDGALRLRLICLGAAAGLLVCTLSLVLKIQPSRELDGEILSFEAEAAEFPRRGENYTAVTVKLRDSSLPRVKAVIYFFGTEAPELFPGDRLRLEGQLRYAGERYGQDWYGQISEGVYLLCYPRGDVEVTGSSSLSFMYFPRYIERAVKATVLKVCKEDSAAFITALITGDKQLLYDDTELYVNMSKAGILHVVAVSGMHVAFLVGFLRLFIRKKKTASMVGIPLLWVFAAVAGWTPSVVRAAFMHSMVLTAPLVNRENDGVTSLSAILALLLLINPESCTSVSLQLSFSAVAGMLYITPRVYGGLTRLFNRKRRGRRSEEKPHIKAAYSALYAVFASVAATIGALAVSAPVSVYYFGALPTYGILANILVFWAVSACFILSYAAVLTGMVLPPLGKLLGFAAGALSEYVAWVVKTVGNLPYSRLWTDKGYFLFWLISLYVIFIGWALWRRGRSFRPVIPLSLTVSLLLVGVIGLELKALRAPVTFTAADVGQGQSLIISEKGRAFVIDCGGVGKTENAGDKVASLLLSRGINRIEALCVTHFDDDHVNGLERLIYQVDVERLILPPEAEEEGGNRAKLLELADREGIEVYIISEDTLVEAGSISLTAFRPVSRREPELIYHVRAADRGILITGDAYMDTEARLLLGHSIPETDIFVAGHHGSKHSSGSELLRAIQAETVVISCGWNSYGHPSEEALSRFAEEGMEILRTDESGTVDILLESAR